MRRVRFYMGRGIVLLLIATLGAGASTDYATALALLKDGRPGDALPLLEAARRREPQNPDVLYNLAGCYFLLQRPNDGIEAAAELARQNLRDPAVLLAAGTLMADHGAPSRAAGLLAGADAIAPGNPLVLAALASAQYRAGDAGAAVNSLEKLLSHLRSTARPETRSTLAKAAETAHALHSSERRSLQTGMLAAEFDLLSDRPREALEILTPLEAAGKNNPDYYKLLGLAAARLDRLPSAIRAHQEALRLSPGRQDLLLNLAAVYQKSRDNESAIRLLESALARNAASPQIYFALALSQFNFGSFEEAERNCARALSADPRFDRAALLRGRALRRLSRPKDAMDAFRLAFQINPACEYCRYELATLLLAENRLTEAEPLLREVVTATPSNASAQFELGKLLHARGDTAGAIRALESAVAANPEQDEAWYLLGRIHMRTGERSRAQRELETVKQIKERRRSAAERHLAGPGPEDPLTPAQP
jgi:tetratricopeptide (TPR) repeat protein